MAESHFLPTVTLFDWWLVKSPDNRLSISGISSRKGEAVRVFNSSPIVVRYDECYLETADGISILIRGIIDKERTLENGFTPEIFKSFYFSFPPNWESRALDCFREEAEHVTDSVNAVMDTVSATCEDISCEGEENSIPAVSLVLPEEALGNRKEPFAAEECNDSKETSRCDVVYCSTGLRDIKVCQQKQQQPASGGSLRHPDKEQSSFSNALENHDLDTVVLDNVSENLPEISSDAVEKSFHTLVSPEKAARDCKQFVEDEHDISIKMSEVNIAQCSVGNRRSARLRNVKVYPWKQPTTGGPAKHPDEDQVSASTSLEKSEGGQKSPSTPIESQSNRLPNTFSEQVVNKFTSSVSETLSAKTERCLKKKRVSIEIEAVRPKRKSPHVRDVSHLNQGSKQSVSLESLSLKKSKYGEENSIPVSLVLPEEALGNRKEPFAAEECNDSKETSRCDVVYCSPGLHDIKVCQQKQQQPASGGSLRHPDKEQSSFSKALENHDLDTVVLDNVSENLPEISSDAVEKSFPTLVSPEKAARDCTQFVEDEHDIPIKMSEVNIVQCSVGNRRSARLCNFKVYPRKQPTTGGPSKHPDEDQISASTSLEKSEGGQKSPSTPIESQSKRLLNTFSEQVVNKFASRVSKTLSAKTERCYKKKRVSIEIEAVRPKRKSPHVRDVSHLNQGSKQSVSLESLSLKKSKYGRSPVPPLEFWHNQVPEETLENNQTPFPGDECEVLKEMSGVNVASGSVGNICSTRLHNINVCQPKKIKKQKQQPTSRGPLKHSHEEPSSTSKAVENRDLDAAHLDNVSANLPEISCGAVENSFPTSSVTPEKAMGHCKKLFLEGEEDMSIKTSEANVVHGSGGNRRSARLHNVKSFQKKQPATESPATRLGKDTTTIEKSDRGLENLSTPVQSQNGILNTPSRQVTNKLVSKISKTSLAKTEVGRVIGETEAVTPKREVMKPSSFVKSPQGRDVSQLNKGSKQGLSIVSPESLSLKKSRSGRLLLPSMEFWRNEIPIYNADRGIKEIQQDLNLTSPFRGFSPSPGRF